MNRMAGNLEGTVGQCGGMGSITARWRDGFPFRDLTIEGTGAQCAGRGSNLVRNVDKEFFRFRYSGILACR
jgi:hypothetical protein